MSAATPLSPESRDRACGAVLGALIGDALGGPLEFLGRNPTQGELDRAMAMSGGGHFGLAPGQITDDGELTLALLDAMAHASEYPMEAVACAYVGWLDSRPFDSGVTTTKALRGVQAQAGGVARHVMEAANRHNLDSKANGSLMRITPLGAWAATVPLERALRAARLDARLTHPNHVCQHAAAAYVAAIRHLVLFPGGSSERAIHAARSAVADELDDEPSHGPAFGADAGLTIIDGPAVLGASPAAEVRHWIDDAVAGHLPPFHPQAGYVRIAFTHALHHLSHQTEAKIAMRQVLAGGGDTDTNACILGGLLGARDGAAALPGLWRSAVLGCNSQLGRQPRPALYSAANLAERVARLLP